MHVRSPCHVLQEPFMSRNRNSIRFQLAACAAFVMCAAGVAQADDNSMSQWTGDSYAFFNNLDYSLGKFNTAHAPQADGHAPIAISPRRDDKTDKRVLLATRPATGTRISPFSDDKGA